jgi:hypothetical protein
MIPEPQLTYVLELLASLGPAADDFVVAGAQAMKFTVAEARATKDVDFVLNVLGLRAQPQSLAETLAKLGNTPVPESRNFQFVKPIPTSKETMRIEFMAPEEFNLTTTFALTFRKVSTPALARGDQSLSRNPTHTPFRANCPTEPHSPDKSASPVPTLS